MARHMNPKLRFLGILIAVSVIFGGLYMYSRKQGNNQSLDNVINTIAPKGRQVKSILDEKKEDAVSARSQRPQDNVLVIKIGVVTWGGYIGGQYFNEGFRPNTRSRFYKDYGFEVNFIILDDFEASRNAWKAGEVDLLWVTADAFPTETQALIESGNNPKIVFQADWSRGGDAIVTTHNINSVRDLKGRKIAAAPGTPSHSFLLLMLQADELEYTDVTIVGVKSAVDAAAAFKNGAVDAAVVWSPDDEDCLRTVTGSKILKSSKGASIIADCFFAKEEFIEQHQKELAGLVEGWLKGAAEINSNPEAKEKAVKILAEGLNIDADLARKSIDNVRLTTYGDNVNFFNLQGDYKGVKGEDLYTKMGRLYYAINMAPQQLPPWRNVTDLSILRAVHLEGAEHMAEGEVKFSKPTKVEETAPAFASKALSVSFATNSAELDENAKVLIKIQFGDVAKFFAKARVRVEGNTDSTGNEEMNQKLSYSRAKTVASFLIAEYKFDQNRFVVIGNGSSKPIASNDTAEGRARNRRTDFSFLN